MIVFEAPPGQSRARAWEECRVFGRFAFCGKIIADHDWRRDHDYARQIWRWYAVAIEHEDGPDTWIAYDGTERRGTRLEIP